VDQRSVGPTTTSLRQGRAAEEEQAVRRRRAFTGAYDLAIEPGGVHQGSCRIRPAVAEHRPALVDLLSRHAKRLPLDLVGCAIVLERRCGAGDQR